MRFCVSSVRFFPITIRPLLIGKASFLIIFGRELINFEREMIIGAGFSVSRRCLPCREGLFFGFRPGLMTKIGAKATGKPSFPIGKLLFLIVKAR